MKEEICGAPIFSQKGFSVLGHCVLPKAHLNDGTKHRLPHEVTPLQHEIDFGEIIQHNMPQDEWDKWKPNRNLRDDVLPPIPVHDYEETA